MARKQTLPPAAPILTVKHTGEVTLDVSRDYQPVGTVDDLQEFVDHARSLAAFYGSGHVSLYDGAYSGNASISYTATKKESSK